MRDLISTHEAMRSTVEGILIEAATTFGSIVPTCRSQSLRAKRVVDHLRTLALKERAPWLVRMGTLENFMALNSAIRILERDQPPTSTSQPHVIQPDGTITPCLPANGTDFTLEELYTAIGAEMVELVPLADGLYLVGDEEGYRNHKEVNLLATEIYRKATELNEHFIVGAVLICPQSMIK